MGLPFGKKKKFILMIGDDGAILILINKDKVERRLFTKSASLSDRREFNALFLKHPEVPIVLSIDTMEQSYTKQTLPAVSSFAIGKLVKKRLDRDFAASDIKGAVLLGRDTEGRKDWMYLFVSSPLTSNVSEWVDYVLSLDNRFEGIYMLPIEFENLAKALNKKLLKPKEKPKDWQFILTSNKTGGYRQVILYKEKVIFTRLIRAGKDTIIDIVAGNIEQEVLNTIDYIRRLGFKDDSEISIYAVLPKEIKKSMSDAKINGNSISIYTPYEMADLLGLKGVVNEEDKFSDVVLAANFARSKPVLHLDNPKMKSINSILMFSKVVNSITMLTVPALTIFAGYLTYKIFSLDGDIKSLENRKVTIEKKWKDAQKRDEYDIDEANKINNVYIMHKKLSDSPTPLGIIEQVIVPNTNHALTESFTWGYVKGSDNNYGTSSAVENAKFDLKFTNVGNSVDDLFKNFEQFNKSLKEVSEGYDVELSELPKTITFEDNKRVIPVKLKLKTSSGNNNNNNDGGYGQGYGQPGNY